MTDEDESTDPGIIAAVFATRSRHDGGISVPHEIGKTASLSFFPIASGEVLIFWQRPKRHRTGLSTAGENYGRQTDAVHLGSNCPCSATAEHRETKPSTDAALRVSSAGRD
jgi:hypothetical protein